ncbi:MAG: alpha/beta fold hydrolase [Proteobacteria bacterium]|nr:alpha/beta fold hydrolase [Pseudomonadota bacterium]MBU1584203.1 alpha/beta fold hydrolase [Pseudomonadota bacterium]
MRSLLVPDNIYAPPFLFGNGHIQTIFPVIFRKVEAVWYERERITTFDNDFLDLDWSTHGHKRLAIVSHGLEGNSSRAYVKGMVKAINHGGWDALAWNYRSCSGEPNRRLRSYHNGVTDDLARVIDHAKNRFDYQEIALVGFSLGGNLTLLHLGRETPDPIVKKAVVFSVPCDLKESAASLAKPVNKLYMKRFLVLLHEKIKAKMKLLPGQIDDKGYEKIKDFKAFDDRYTAPIHGFKNANDYWKKCSSKPYIPDITVPTLIVNAVNDPFLPQACFPEKEAGSNRHVTLLMPKSGGHVGFISFNKQNRYWSEKQTMEFLN